MEKKYSLVLAGIDRLSVMFRDSSKESERLTGKLREQEKAVRQLESQSRSIATFERQRAEFASLGNELTSAKAKLQALTAEVAAAGEPTRAQARALKASQKEVDQLSRSFDRQQVKVDAAGESMRKAGVDANSLAGAQDRLKKETDAANVALEKQRGKLKALAAAQKRLDRADDRISSLRGQATETAVTAAALALPVARAVSAESAMADVAKVVDFSETDGGAEKKAFQSALARQAVAANMGFGDSAEIAAAAGQSGIKKDELLNFTQSASRMSVAFDMMAGDAGTTMAAWRAAMGLGQERVEQLADAVNHVSNNMNAKASDLSGVLKRQGAVALASGLSPEQAASLGGALLSSGASEETAATSMKNMLGALTRGGAATNSQREALESIGLDAESLASDMQSDAVRTITEVFRALADAPIEEQSALVSQLFGDESKGGIMPLLTNLERLDHAFGLTSEKTKYAGAVNAEYEKRMATSGHTFGQAGKSFDYLITVVGGSLLPVLTPVADAAGKAAMWLAKTAESHEKITAAATLGAAAFVAWKIAKLGYMYVAAKVEQVQARHQVTQARLAATEGNTATMATRAAAALTRLNAALAGTAMAGKAGMAGAAADALGGVAGGKGGKGKGGRFKMRGGGLVGGAVVAGATLLPMLVGGDSEAMTNADIGSTVGSVAGGAGGWIAGAAAGAALGSVVPVIGTVVGGVVGGLLGGYLGGEAGDYVGGKAGALFDGDASVAGGASSVGGVSHGGAEMALAGSALGMALPVIGPLSGALFGGLLGDFLSSKDDDGSASRLPSDDPFAKPAVRQISYSPSIRIDQLPPNISKDEIVEMVIQKQRENILPMLMGPGFAMGHAMEMSE
jgi:TP901 family phage tail tape measure protein